MADNNLPPNDDLAKADWPLLNVRVHPDDLAALDAKVAALRTTRSELVRRWILSEFTAKESVA